MAFEHEQRAALRILHALEGGTMSTSATYGLVDDADPTLVYLIFTWIRAHYPSSHPAADAVLGRLAELCSAHPGVTTKVREGQADPIVEWFEDTYNYRELQAEEFIALVIEKLEG
jgi:hypothetical protein